MVGLLLGLEAHGGVWSIVLERYVMVSMDALSTVITFCSCFLSSISPVLPIPKCFDLSIPYKCREHRAPTFRENFAPFHKFLPYATK